MPPTQKKPKDTLPAEAADIEANPPAAGDTPPPIIIQFRGQEFSVAREVTTSAQFIFSLALPGTQTTIYQALGPIQAATFIALMKPGEQWLDVSNEFMKAFNAAAGWGNS